jgi:hypothetical protein
LNEENQEQKAEINGPYFDDGCTLESQEETKPDAVQYCVGVHAHNYSYGRHEKTYFQTELVKRVVEEVFHTAENVVVHFAPCDILEYHFVHWLWQIVL